MHVTPYPGLKVAASWIKAHLTLPLYTMAARPEVLNTDLQDTVEKVMNSQEQLNAASYFKVQAEERRMWEQLRSDIVKANVDEATANEQIDAVGLANWNSILTGIERISKTKLNEQQSEK